MIWTPAFIQRMFSKLRFLGILITVSFAYTFIIALLSAPSINEIVYYPDALLSGLLFGAMAWVISAFVFSKISESARLTVKGGFLVNLTIGFVVTAVLLSLIVWGFYALLSGEWLVDFRTVKELLMILNFQLIVSLVYLGQAFATFEKEGENTELMKENQELIQTLGGYKQRVIATTNGRARVFDIEEVKYFRIDQGVIFAHLSNQHKYPIQETTLSQLEERLNPDLFLRINRSEIVNINAVEGYEPYFKDRLSVKLKGITQGVYTSNTRSSVFRGWIT